MPQGWNFCLSSKICFGQVLRGHSRNKKRIEVPAAYSWELKRLKLPALFFRIFYWIHVFILSILYHFWIFFFFFFRDKEFINNYIFSTVFFLFLANMIYRFSHCDVYASDKSFPLMRRETVRGSVIFFTLNSSHFYNLKLYTIQ